MDNKSKLITCRQTLVVSNHRVFPQDLNNYGFMFGGRLLAILDDVASISVSRFTRRQTVTASIDQCNFLRSFQKDNSVCMETYVSGVGSRSIEVFAKVIGESLFSDERYIGATAFMTFVLRDSAPVINQLVPESDEEKAVVAGYAARKANRHVELIANQELMKQLNTNFPW
ncbi:acyl-CoA thioesterase [Agrilactobacillus yilanensis]|uniref:Acyl-CoA thioesterase n=1 Tax=Agrilactobacillus yilanensis TaxID=2485997 RepID=A0ABW4J725_9LACO|nr:acyl-CoA thioesterase [Agrilactobacillus yilanensis]